MYSSDEVFVIGSKYNIQLRWLKRISEEKRLTTKEYFFDRTIILLTLSNVKFYLRFFTSN